MEAGVERSPVIPPDCTWPPDGFHTWPVDWLTIRQFSSATLEFLMARAEAKRFRLVRIEAQSAPES